MNLFKKEKKTSVPAVADGTPVKNKKKKKVKEKTDWVAWFAGFISVIVILGMAGCIGGVAILGSMLKDKPELDIYDFQNSESSIVYDRNGEIIAELGATIRENVSYEDLPNNVIDAFVAVEDSRFFEHNGFDLPRFTKAFLENIKSLSFSQGGSTFTMQLVKNTYFTNDATGTNASRSGMSGVKRKVQEIALAMELEKEISKEKILELYLNKLNYGGGNRNIRGIQKASLYYFGKPVTEVNLPEAAFLAGVVNAPNAYNPYYHLEAATNRRNNVLYLMRQHGYISEDEYNLAINTRIEDSLVSDSSTGVGSKRGSGNGVQYQAYIDAVVSEVYDLTGLDPYTTTMKIYTSMDQGVQTMMDNIQKGDIDGYYEFPDDNFELASIATNVKNGEIVGILGGRNYADGGALLLNHATEQFKQPGSSIKPILDYILAFENLGWATDHVLVDKPINYVGTNIVIGNSDGIYRGEVTLTDCIGYSLNTTALQTIQQVVNKIGVANVVSYLNTIGFDQATVDNFNVQWGIGGGEFYVSVEQMASAIGSIINKGQYYEPHTIRKIEFQNGKAPVEPQYMPAQGVSEQAAYLMSEILYKNVNAGYANLLNIIKENDYAVYGKTGTTDWSDSGKAYGIPVGAIKDGWVVASTSDFAVATWVGYEKAIANEPSYMTLADYLKCIKEKTTNLVLDSTVESFGIPDAKMERPDGISTITHIISVFPYVSPIDGMSDEYISTGEIITKYAELGSPESLSVESIKDDCKVTYDVHQVLSLTWPEYPDKDKLEVAPNTMDLTLDIEDDKAHLEATGRRLFDYSWVYGAVKYKAKITVLDADGKTVDSKNITSGTNTYSTNELKIGPGNKVVVEFYYDYEHKNTNPKTIKKEIEIVDEDVSITNLTSATDIKQVEDWCKDYNIPKENIKEETAPTLDKEHKVVVKVDGVEQTATSFKTKMSKLKSIEVIYYTEAQVEISATTTPEECKVNEEITLTVHVTNGKNPQVTISCESAYLGLETTTLDCVENVASVKFTPTKDGTYVVKIKENISGKSIEKEIVVQAATE